MNKQRKDAYSGERSYAHRGGRKGFSRDGGVLCKSCFEKDQEIDRLREESKRLKHKIKYLEETKGKITHKDVDSAHTPSSKRQFKKNSPEANQIKMGGATEGHPGSGRGAISPGEADQTLRIEPLDQCPDCECRLEVKDSRLRSVLEAQPLRAKKVIYRCSRSVCPECLKTYTASPTAIPKSLYGNSLLAQAAVLHFIHGVTLGKVRILLGQQVTEGGLISALHGLGSLCQQALAPLIDEYRRSPVKHADETGWRTDGHSGYAWLFCTPAISLFEFRDTRAARVAKEILGSDSLPGVLVVDRYGGYNRMPCRLQYCYAHLLREVEKLEEEFSDSAEVTRFTSELATELTRAMKLRGRGLPEDQYKREAQQIKGSIEQIVGKKAKHLGIRRIQQIFQEKENRLYHWVDHPEVPPENNRAERELRPTVIARKVSFGSQSAKGAKTRSRIMSVLWTAKKRFPDKPVEQWLTESLDAIARNPRISLAECLKPPDPSTPSN